MSPQFALRRVLFTLLGLVVALGGSILLAPAAHAQVAPQSYTVTTADDTPTDTNCAPASCTLRQAVNASNLNDPGSSPAHNTITFAAGVSGPIALTNDPTHGTLTLIKSVTITSPGGITVDGGSAFSVFAVNEGVTASISGLNISNGGGAGGGGGVRNNGNLSLLNLSLTNSSSDGGGGVLNNASGILTVTGCTLTNNSAPDLGGGAIFNGGMATITNSSFAQNNAGFGGAIGNSNSATLIVTGSAFTGNTSAAVSIGSGEGGAIHNGHIAQVTNSTFTNNSASTKGGGIYNNYTLQTTNVTVSGNQATTSGGGIYSAGAATLTNTLVAGSTGGDLSNSGAPTGTFSGNTNLIDDSTISLLAGTGNINRPALLDPTGAQPNGGPTQTVALLPGSPAIGGGTPTGEGIPTTDQRNEPRTGHNDIGAFQAQGFALALMAGTTPQSTLINSQFTNPLGVAVTSPINDPVIGGTVTFTLPSGAGIPSGTFGAPGACTVSGDNLTATCPITGNGPVSLCAVSSGPHRSGCGTPSGTSTSPTVTANGTTGPFNANATTNGAPPAAPFVLKNLVVACVVDSTQDPAEAGKTTLRDAVRIADSGACTNNNTITFADSAFPPGTAETIFVAASAFELSFTGGTTTIDGTNHTVVLDGGGKVNSFAVDANVTATLIGLTMQNGFNSDGGGAILNLGTLTVASSTMDHNNGFFFGGAIENLNVLAVTNSTFTNNTAGDGGAIDTNNGTLTVTGSSFITNTAILPARERAVRPSRTIRPADGFTNAGGAIFICACTGATITNSTFSGNTAGSAGGAILDEGGLTLTNVTISGNSASNGGGILVDGSSRGSLIATNTLIAGNTLSGSGGAGPDVNGPVDPTGASNLIGVGDGGTGLINNTNGNLIGTSAAPIAALLGPLGNYGGSTQTIPLLPGSPAIDAGTTAKGVPATDQRGKPRVGAPDIGAFESQGFTLAIVSGTPQTKQISTAFAPLVVSVTSVSAEPVNGGIVTFTGPTSGAGIQTSPVTVTIPASGQASITPAANATAGGPYTVTAAMSGALPPSVPFRLINAAPTLIVSGPAHLKVGETEQYTATQPSVAGSAQSPAGVVWKSSDESIATMSADGKLNALRPGSVTVTATANGLVGSLPVQVDAVILTGVQAAPAPAGRPSGAAANPGATVPAPAPAPPSR